MNIYCDSSTKEACFVVEGQEPVIIAYPKPVTNNVGEYSAVLTALCEAQYRQLEDVVILTDSQLVVEQVKGTWKVRHKHLLPYRDKVRELAQIINAKIEWISREENLAGRVLG